LPPSERGRIVLGLCVPHTPRIVDAAAAAPAFQPMVHAMQRARDTLLAHDPDAVILVSAHWATTFNPYVDVAEWHRGILTAMECPDLIGSIVYDFPGDPELGNLIVDRARADDVPAIAVDQPHHVLDYGTIVPVRYLVPDGGVPVVPISSCPLSTIAEYLRFGAAIREAVAASGRRVAIVASSAFAHNLVRGPETWPAPAERAIDDHLIALLTRGDFGAARELLPAFATGAKYEMGGKPVAAMLGALGDDFRGEFYAYGPSSGSGNPILAFEPLPALAA
jgi:3,4-dihydroxyphenylacetate 2,3-dioxygenase